MYTSISCPLQRSIEIRIPRGRRVYSENLEVKKPFCEIPLYIYMYMYTYISFSLPCPGWLQDLVYTNVSPAFTGKVQKATADVRQVRSASAAEAEGQDQPEQDARGGEDHQAASRGALRGPHLPGKASQGDR